MLIDEIKNRLNIIELAKSEGLQLKKQSNRIYKTTCCFHKETKASLTFYADTNTFFCFACQAKGDPINFYAKRHSISNKEAIKQLARRYGLITSFRGLNRAERGSLVASQSQDFSGIGETLAKRFKQTSELKAGIIYEALKEFCGDLDAESLTYLTGDKRGLTPETIKKFNIFSIKDYKKTKEFLLKRFDLKELRELVLFESRLNRFSFIKNKIIIPVIKDGRIIALRGRYLSNGQDDPSIVKTTYSYPKYKSTAGVADQLFNADILKRLRKRERVYLAEGEFDTMILDQHGKKAVGLLGVSNYSNETIKQLNDFDLVIAFDNDERGRAEALKVSNIFYKQTGREVIREKLPDGIKDITELFILKAKQNGKV